ncbi:MAG: protoporphyrinogen oxidase [Proteobacteria bacterium]|nr:protoporphyrinogen oxidase [Pseudomonadota bacterium]
MIETVIVGAGLAGLTLAHRLKSEGQEVRVLEASARTGGSIATDQVDGMTIERGPQACPTTAIAVYDLISALGAAEQVVVAQEAARKRFLLHDRRLEPLPQKFKDVAKSPLLGMRAMGRAMSEPLVRRAPDPGETVYDFIARRFGPAVAERFATAFVAGVYGGDARELEVGAAFEDWVSAERRHGSLVRGMMNKAPHPAHAPRNLFTLKGGMVRLTDALTASVHDTLALNSPVERIEHQGNHFVVHGAQPLKAKKVVITVPPLPASRLLPDLADLAAIPSAPIAGVHLAWPAGTVQEQAGFGWLAAPEERKDVLGTLWVTAGFPGHAPGHVMKRVMLGGTRDPSAVALDDAQLIERARRVLREVEGIQAPPVFAHVARSRIGIPQYVRGHLARMARLKRAHPGLRFLGWGYTGVGVSHCVQAAMHRD